MPEYVRYRPDVEVPEAGERELFEKIVQALSHGEDMAAEAGGGHYIRPSHAKAHGHLKGEMRVLEDLPAPFRQGVFAEAATFPVLARLAEDSSPFVTVARLVFPVQNAYSEARRAFVDERMSFCPAHTLPEHQPLGGINRARLFAYEKLAERRAEKNGTTIVEPLSLDEVPD